MSCCPSPSESATPMWGSSGTHHARGLSHREHGLVWVAKWIRLTRLVTAFVVCQGIQGHALGAELLHGPTDPDADGPGEADAVQGAARRPVGAAEAAVQAVQGLHAMEGVRQSSPFRPSCMNHKHAHQYCHWGIWDGSGWLMAVCLLVVCGRAAKPAWRRRTRTRTR